MTMPIRRSNSWDISPFKELEHLQDEMNRLFDLSFPRGSIGEKSLLAGQWVPALDVYDSKDNIVVKADLPGLTKEDIDVSLQEDTLTIKGEKKNEAEIKSEDYLRTERYYGHFHRIVSLPSRIDTTKVRASFKDGVLELTLPKKEEAKPKQIKVDVK